jgi:hypothetical protein
VPTGLTPNQMRSLARLGAERRIEELQTEIAAIRREFPASGAASRGRPTGTSQRDGSVRRRRKMSPEARRAVSERMKKYWADYRKKKAQGR